MTEYLTELRKEIEGGLSGLDFPANPSNLYEPISYMLSLGGKRIRPTLVLLGCELFGGERSEALPQALAIEVFHNFTLVHDDIMDDAVLRRSLPTVHEKWNRDIAILSGDAMMIKAYQLLFQAHHDKLHDLQKVFSQVAVEVCEGQQRDMDYAMNAEVSVKDYLDMIRLKTAVLLGVALELGAIMAGSSQNQRADIREFGVDLGMAFQLQDDFLDAFGDQASFGKRIGGDIREGKRTWLTLKAYELASPGQNDQLNELFNSRDENARVEGVMKVYNDLDIKSLAAAEIEQRIDKVLASADGIDGNPPQILELKRLIQGLLIRIS